MRSALAAAVVVLFICAASLAACGDGADATEFSGTALSEDAPAPDFVLTDQFGDSVSLSQMRGRAVALSFLFTSCPDVCPIVTTQLKRLYDELGADADSVEFVSVSVDPERDDPLAAMRYLERWEVADEWRYLTGPRADLAPIWEAYYISPVIDDPNAAARIALIAPGRRNRRRAPTLRRDRRPPLRNSRAILDNPLRPRLSNRPQGDAPRRLHPAARHRRNGVGH